MLVFAFCGEACAQQAKDQPPTASGLTIKERTERSEAIRTEAKNFSKNPIGVGVVIRASQSWRDEVHPPYNNPDYIKERVEIFFKERSVPVKVLIDPDTQENDYISFFVGGQRSPASDTLDTLTKDKMAKVVANYKDAVIRFQMGKSTATSQH